MKLRIPKLQIIRHLPVWLRPHGRFLAIFAAAVLATIALAWVIPISVPETDAPSNRRLFSDAITPRAPPPEDLTAFENNRRWGTSLRRLGEREAEKQRQSAAATLNPVLKKLGYVGLITEAGRHTILLTKPDGTVARLRPGDALPDGRILAAVSGNAITLRAGDQEEYLELFPSLEDQERDGAPAPAPAPEE